MDKIPFTEHDLLLAFLTQTDINVFWKDHNRRFLGASQSFLDFYGLDREDLIGKTDEEMGWHINPEPYMNDEYQVIQTGTPVYESAGKCIIKGQVRHILATKLPIHNASGQIVGLVGYFRDVTDQKIRQIPKNDKPSVVSETILSLLEHIRLKQREVRLIDEHSFLTDLSLGWAAYSEFNDVTETLRNADLRMYRDRDEPS